MFRDKGPLHNIGYGVSSRDLPSREGETETPSPNSGFIGKALDNHPFMKFLGSAAVAMTVSYAGTRLLRSGGLKLGKFLQSQSDAAIEVGKSNTLPTRIVKSVTELRKSFDQLQGVTRYVDGVDDAYSKIVHEVDGKYTTGYDIFKPKHYEQYGYLRNSEITTTNRGMTSESAAVWTLKDQLQKQMVRAGRRLPYELPALYVTQRAITEPLFSHNQDRKKVNWYNPVDVLADFAKQSVINVATITLPFEALGAAGAAGKSSLTTLANSMNDMRALSPVQQIMAGSYINLRELMAEVGQDLTDLTAKTIKISSQTSRSFCSWSSRSK